METTLDFGEIPPIWRIQFIAEKKHGGRNDGGALIYPTWVASGLFAGFSIIRISSIKPG